MKQRFGLTLLLAISTLFFGCGKVEPPTQETEPVKAKPKSGFTIDNKVEINHAANVTVVDAETGLAIEGAKVRGRIDADDTGPEFVEGIEIGDGEYYLPTEDLKGSYYAGAMAEDYHGNASYTPSFPYEIRLTRGETVTVSGEIIDEFHQPVTRGVMNLRVDKDWGNQWPKFYLNSEKINQHGKFRLENIPANVKDVYAKYECFGEPAFDFKDQSFDIEYDDIYLKLQLPSKLIIRGKVIYSSGEAVSGAWVWVEKVTGEELDPWNKLLQNKRSALDKVSFCTKADGEFELKLNTIKDKYSIKAYHPSSLPAYKGPYSDDNPPTEFVELVIKNEGARLAGRISNSKGEPITACSAKYFVLKPTGHNSMSGNPNNLKLDIDENGDYISGIVPTGLEQVEFRSPGYNTINKSVTIIENKQTLLDVKFNANPAKTIITGLVYSTETKLPISGVTVRQRGVNGTQTTDEKGRFTFIKKTKDLKFSAPGYGYLSMQFNDEKLGATYPKFYMSPAGSVRLVVTDENGNRLNGNKVDMRYDMMTNYEWINGHSNREIKNGEILFENLLSHMSSAEFTIKDLKNNKKLMEIKNVKIKPSEEVVVYTNLPPVGSLVLEFESAFNFRELTIALRSKGLYFWTDKFNVEGQTLKSNDIPATKYTLQVGSGPSNNNLLHTNIFILKGALTTIKIDNNKESFGTIKGSVKTISGKNLPCNIKAIAQENPEVTCNLFSYYDNNFVINQLPKKYIYNLEIKANGNSTNIVIKDVVPDGELNEIVLPDAFAITGSIVDANGKTLNAEILMNNFLQKVDSEFKLYPIFPGKYDVYIKVDGYAKYPLQVEINNSDVDLGEIVIKDKGLTISGRYISEDNGEASQIRTSLMVNSKHVKRIIVDINGCFEIKHVQAGQNLKIRYWRKEIDLGVVSADLDLGDIKVSDFKAVE